PPVLRRLLRLIPGCLPPLLHRRGSASGSGPAESASPPARPASSGSFGRPMSSASAKAGPTLPLRRTTRFWVTLRVALPAPSATCLGPRSWWRRSCILSGRCSLRWPAAASASPARSSLTLSVHVMVWLRTSSPSTSTPMTISSSSFPPPLRARVAVGGLRTGGFRLLFTPWSHSRDAVPVKAWLVSIEITGIPDNAWHRSSAEFLLSPFCRVENLAPETRDASDMSVFRLTAWTTNPDGIPCLS
uniref:DUF4283 domain-containing protein n=1 Tax=Aegilops tauschii subsp. strangulata TaxID=200361 RepID=A0A453FEU7_AEGTS